MFFDLSLEERSTVVMNTDILQNIKKNKQLLHKDEKPTIDIKIEIQSPLILIPIKDEAHLISQSLIDCEFWLLQFGKISISSISVRICPVIVLGKRKYWN